MKDEVKANLLDHDGNLLLVGDLELLPSVLRRSLVIADAAEVEETVGIALGSDVTLLLAGTAGLMALLGAVGPAVANLAAATALAGEFALDGRVRAVGLVVTWLVAVVAEAGVLLFGLRAVAREVTLGAAALQCQSSTNA